jgi:hypothetical protein
MFSKFSSKMVPKITAGQGSVPKLWPFFLCAEWPIVVNFDPRKYSVPKQAITSKLHPKKQLLQLRHTIQSLNSSHLTLFMATQRCA